MENYRVYGKNAGKHHDRTSVEKLSSGFIQMLEKFHRMTEGERIADIGCATGRDLRYLHNKLGRDNISYGLDAATEMIEFADGETENNDIMYSVADMSSLPFTTDSIYGIWCQATIFMVEPDRMRETLNEFYRVLEDKGILSISFKISDSVSSDSGEQIRERWGSNVQYFFVDEDFAVQIVEDAGFSVFNVGFEEFGETKFVNIWANLE